MGARSFLVRELMRPVRLHHRLQGREGGWNVWSPPECKRQTRSLIPSRPARRFATARGIAMKRFVTPSELVSRIPHSLQRKPMDNGTPRRFGDSNPRGRGVCGPCPGRNVWKGTLVPVPYFMSLICGQSSNATLHPGDVSSFGANGIVPVLARGVGMTAILVQRDGNPSASCESSSSAEQTPMVGVLLPPGVQHED